MKTAGIDWPEGRRASLVVTVDFADVWGILAQVPQMAGREKSLSVWGYGAKRGVDRLLRVFDELGVATSWFVAGHAAIEHADLLHRVCDAGHEIGNLGFAADDFDKLALDAQRESFERGQAALRELGGSAPTGFRSATGNWAPGFATVLRNAGVRWSSSWRGDDRPYLHAKAAPGDAPLVEVPLHYELEDDPYFSFNLYPPVPVGQPRIASYREVLANWTLDVDGFRRLGLCATLRVHPETMGTAGRIDVLRDLLAHALRQGDVWTGTGGELAAWWSERYPNNEPRHPVDVFAPLHVAAPRT